MSAKANFTVLSNGVWSQVWQINNSGTPVDVTGYDFKLEIKSVKGPDQAAFLSLTVGDGIEIENALSGIIRITIEPQEEITQSTSFYYDFIAIIEELPYVWLEGKIVFKPGVSYV